MFERGTEHVHNTSLPRLLFTQLLADPEEAKEQCNPLIYYGIADSEWEDDESNDGHTTTEDRQTSTDPHDDPTSEDEDEGDLDEMNPSSSYSSSESDDILAGAAESNGKLLSPTDHESSLVEAAANTENQFRLLAEHEFRLREEPIYQLRYQIRENENAYRLREERLFRSHWEPEYGMRMR